MGCLSVDISRAGCATVGLERIGGVDVTPERIGGACVNACRIGGAVIDAIRKGCVSVGISIVCSVSLGGRNGYLRVPAGYVLTVDGGRLILTEE